MTANDSHTKVISAQVDCELAERLERIAAEQERTLSAEIRLALRAHLARQAEAHNHELQEVA
jgi:predicted transcriptional regulator